MRVRVNGIHLYFDVEGAGLVPDGDRMRQRPTLVLVHGGPGADHAGYKPAFSALSDCAQIVYFDNRGDGRSDRGPKDSWTLAQWADDLHGLCEALSIDRPIVYGASFGGMVAMSYAIRYPNHPGKLILVSTSAVGASHAKAKVAMFERLGGPEAGTLARRRFIDGEAGPELLEEWLRVAVPLYTQSKADQGLRAREVRNPETTAWFNRPQGEARSFDLLAGLASVRCPTLVLGGGLDPMTPIECQRDIAAALAPSVLQYREFPKSGHGVIADEPAQALSLLRQFICSDGTSAAESEVA